MFSLKQHNHPSNRGDVEVPATEKLFDLLFFFISFLFYFYRD